MGKNLVYWWEIAAADDQALAAFYSRVFDWTTSYDKQSTIHTLDSGTGQDGGIPGGIFKPKKIYPHLAIYISVDDVEATLSKAVELGATVEVPITRFPGTGPLALLKDPEGNLFGIIERKAKDRD